MTNPTFQDLVARLEEVYQEHPDLETVDIMVDTGLERIALVYFAGDPVEGPSHRESSLKRNNLDGHYSSDIGPGSKRYFDDKLHGVINQWSWKATGLEPRREGEWGGYLCRFSQYVYRKDKTHYHIKVDTRGDFNFKTGFGALQQELAQIGYSITEIRCSEIPEIQTFVEIDIENTNSTETRPIEELIEHEVRDGIIKIPKGIRPKGA
jgi:hypothetical protein